MKAVEFPLGNLREYFFNEILSKMSPRMGDYNPLQRTFHVWWEYVGLHVITYNSYRRSYLICNCV
jgi:hypothetical protein